MKSREAVDFLKSATERVGIFFDDDPDGTASAALLLVYFKQRSVSAEVICGHIEKEIFEEFKKERFDFYIFCDFALSSYPEFLESFKGKKVLIIDHHPIYKDLNEMGFIFINPRLEDPKAYISTSHLVIDLCKKAGLENFDWLARIGMTGDREIKGNEEENKASNIINSIKIARGYEELPKVARFLSECKRIEEVVYKKEYQKPLEIVDRELERNMDKFIRLGINDFNFFELKSRYGIASTLATKLFDMYPEKTIILYSKGKNYYKFDGRTRKFDIGKIFKEASKGIGNGGGHPVAAGARIDLRSYKEFKKRVLKLISG